jgi:hypothetical protein
MRRLITFALAATALLPAGTARAADTGTIRGRVVDGVTGDPRAGVRVTLQGGNEDGSDPTRATARTGDDGRFGFTGLTTGDDRLYVVDATFEGGLFAGRALRLPADTDEPPVIDTTIKVWETTTDPTVIAITRDDLFLLPSDGGVSVIESVSIFNSSGLAYIGRGADEAAAPGQAPSIGFAVPDEAEDVQIIDSNLDIPGLVAAEFGFGATVAIPPGATRTTFSYRLPVASAQYDLSRTVLYPTAELNVHARPPLTIESNRLEEAGEQSIEGTVYRVWSSEEGIDAGDPVQMLAIADAGTPAALVAGIVAFAVLLAGAGALALRRRSGRPVDARGGVDREKVVTAIARLDVRYEAGEIDRGTWERERARLKRRLAESGAAP